MMCLPFSFLDPRFRMQKLQLLVPSNGTLVHPAYFLLVGIPGLGPNVHFWLAFPLCFMYALATLGNMTIILIIRVERRLHEPMYLFLAMLSTIDIVLSSVTMPKMASLFLTGIQEIEFNICLAQMFLIHALSAMESVVLLAMAFDRFVAICHPLHHAHRDYCGQDWTSCSDQGICILLSTAFHPEAVVILPKAYCHTLLFAPRYYEAVLY